MSCVDEKTTVGKKGVRNILHVYLISNNFKINIRLIEPSYACLL